MWNPESHLRPPNRAEALNQAEEGSKEIFSDLILSLLTDNGEPNYYEEALQVEAKAEWELAMDDERASLLENQT